MKKNKMLEILFKEKLVAIIRNIDTKYIEDTVASIKKGGCNLIEITLDNDNALEQIELLSEDKDLYIGAGTVLDYISCRLAIMSGAKFIVTPTVNKDVIDMAKTYGVPTIIGAMTPTEMLEAYKYGADIIKVFPAGTLGSKYIKNVLGPLSHLPLMATGGINLSNIEEFKEVGVETFGIGSSLVDKELIYKKDYKRIEEETKRYMNLVQG